MSVLICFALVMGIKSHLNKNTPDWVGRKIADLLHSRGNCCKLLRRPAKVLGDAQIRFVGEGDGEPFPSSSSKFKSFFKIPASPSQ